MPSGDHAGPSSCAVVVRDHHRVAAVGVHDPDLHVVRRVDVEHVEVGLERDPLPVGRPRRRGVEGAREVEQRLDGAAADGLVSIARSVSPVGDLTLANRKVLESGETLGRTGGPAGRTAAPGSRRPSPSSTARDARPAAAEQHAAAVRPPGRLARRLPSGVYVSRVMPSPLAVISDTSKFVRLARLADPVGDVASVGRPVRLRVVLRVLGRELAQVRPVVVDGEDVPVFASRVWCGSSRTRCGR